MAQTKSYSGPKIKMIAVIVWLLATLSLTGWWLIFFLRQTESLSQLKTPSFENGPLIEEVTRRYRMFLGEGAFLFFLLLCGGAALFYFLWIEIRQARQIREFFAAFTHDLKTSLASLRLQAETLGEDLQNDPSRARVARRLVKDSVRLELQLENSLFVADTEMGHLHIEDIKVDEVIASLRHYWPEVDIRVEKNTLVRADVRALESIFKNLFQNAFVHGKASRVIVRAEMIDGVGVGIEVEDNGKGFNGEVERLGKMFARHTSTSGSGIGLFLVERLAKRMGGKLDFITGDVTNPQGFRVKLQLPAGGLA